jgi:soluble lytic murein transglycosylase-like protein
VASIPAAPETPGPIPVNAAVAAGSLTELIDSIALKYQVEAPLVHSVIQAESNYNPVAVSRAGAQGIMQLIPSTARRFGVSNSFNVQQNIEGGVKYLRFLLDLYKDDYRKVIAAYNAGEGAVNRYGTIPPYTETLNYVVRVARNLKVARQAAEIKHAAAQPVVQKASVEDTHPIQAWVGDDGKVYYKTQ